VAGGTLITPAGRVRGHLGVRGGRISALSETPLQARETVDATGRVVLPGAVDLHVHFNEPGHPDYEGWAAGSRAAAAGGVTTIADMPLVCMPATTTVKALRTKREIAERTSLVDFALWAGLVPYNLDHLDALHAEGVAGFKAFMAHAGTDAFPFVDDDALYEGLRRAAAAGATVAVHAENHAITSARAARLRAQGRRDRRAWGEARPPIAELEAIARLLTLARDAGCAVHVVHVSLPEGVEAIRAARQRGQRVTCETCAHYLVLTEDDFDRIGPAAKCAPPLRDAARREGLWDAVLRGHVDTLASDHAPGPADGKSRGVNDVFDAWGGIAGIQSALPLLLTHAVRERGMTLEQLAWLTSTNPARIAGLWPRKGGLVVGGDADFVVVDLERAWTLTPDHLYSRNRHSPYVGMEMRGWFTHVLRRGEVIVEDGRAADAGAGGVYLRSQRGLPST
jgi:allantoinase